MNDLKEDDNFKKRFILLALVGLVVVAVAYFSAGFSSFNSEGASSVENGPEPKYKDVTELTIEDTKIGEGAELKAGDKASVHYTGMLIDGTEFDSSLERELPFEFKVGDGKVIKGWDKGVVGMKAGGSRKLIIPSDMGYGEAGSPPAIPPDATLIFDIQLLKITE